MEFRFDANQEYQVRAIDAVADLFDGQTWVAARMAYDMDSMDLLAIPNQLDLGSSRLVANLQNVQKRNGISQDSELQMLTGTAMTAGGEIAVSFPNFSVEMETGTGKTYVYIRTMLELSKRYGMRKFIVVVPSVAVREGVLKTLQITERHLKERYGNPVYHYCKYDSANLTQVRQFAQADSVEIMVMTIDSFNKATNVIQQSTDRLQGDTPVHMVQSARPVLILDEPQNMESENRITALAGLNPLLALRYSATHRNPYNMVYRLTPADAYRQGLVKKIEVDSVVATNDENAPYLRVDSIETQKTRVTARLTVHKLMKTGQVKESAVVARLGDSLVDKTERYEYAGFVIDEISVAGKYIRFGNNRELREGDEIGSDKEAIFTAQIRHTIEEHFRKQDRLKSAGIKVLSLFFIDRVANYASDDGIIRRLFDQAFNEMKAGRPDWETLDASEVQAAYFSQKKRKGGEIETLDSAEGKDKGEDESTYDLIMRDKESLLTFAAPGDDPETQKKRQVRFIFSHSALREGWDNPNVFQICTLNQTISPMKKRQEVGRGIRLAVDQSGSRVHDDAVNILTVVANESYLQYVAALQSEIAFEYRSEIEKRYGKSVSDLTDDERRKVEEEYGEGILPPKPRQAHAPKARLRKARVVSDEFKDLWDRIKHKTRYSVQIDTEALLSEALPEIERTPITPPSVTVTKAEVHVSDENAFWAAASSRPTVAVVLAGKHPLPNLVDLMENLMENTSPPVRLSRRTLLDLFARLSDRRPVMDNPHEWATVAVRVLKEKLAEQLVNGIRYEKTGEWYDMKQILEEEEIELFSKYMVPVDESRDKTIYDVIPCDSAIEQQFVKDLEGRTDVRLYAKLPYWFTVPTPVGEYRPDWAILMEDADGSGTHLLYLVCETKGSTRKADLRLDEWRKIQCGAAHFGSRMYGKAGALEGVDYKVVTTADQLPELQMPM